MKSKYYIVAIVVFVCSFLALGARNIDSPTNVVVYGLSDSGYSWIRTYSGPEDQSEALVADLVSSYKSLTMSLNAGSSLKIFVQGSLRAEESNIGDAKKVFSESQIAVHDEFANQNSFSTIDPYPESLAKMEFLEEPYICGK